MKWRTIYCLVEHIFWCTCLLTLSNLWRVKRFYPTCKLSDLPLVYECRSIRLLGQRWKTAYLYHFFLDSMYKECHTTFLMKWRAVYYHRNSRNQNNIAFGLVPWVPFPTEWHASGQMTPALQCVVLQRRTLNLLSGKFSFCYRETFSLLYWWLSMHVLCSRACLLRLRTMQTFLRKQFRTKDKHCLTHKTCKKSIERCLLTSLIYMKFTLLSFPGDSVVKNPQCRRHEFIPWLGKIHWRRKWQLTSVFLPGKSHG